MSKQQQQTWQTPDKSPLGQSNQMLVIVFNASDLRGMITTDDSTRVIVWEVAELKQKTGFPDGAREVVSIVGRKDVEFPTWLDQAISKSNGRYVFNRYKQESMTLEEILQRLGQRLQRPVPAALSSDTPALDQLEKLVRREYDVMAPNSMTEVQRATGVARKEIGNHITQPMVQEFCTIIDAEQGCRQGEKLRNAILAALEVGSSYEDKAYLARLVVAAKAAGFPLLLPAGAKRIAERLKPATQTVASPAQGDIPALASVSDEDILGFLRIYYSQLTIPQMIKQHPHLDEIYAAIQLQRVAIAEVNDDNEARLRRLIGVIRLEKGVSKANRLTQNASVTALPLTANSDLLTQLAGAVVTARSLPERVQQLGTPLKEVVAEVLAAQQLFQVLPEMQKSNPIEDLRQLLSGLLQQLTPKSE